jgi:AraC family transcriptional regulator of adaptative response / DNA-3-methyladenine glycosylase II
MPETASIAFIARFPGGAAAGVGGVGQTRAVHERDELAQRAGRLLADGVLDREGLAGLVRRLSATEAQVRAALGADPAAVARTQQAATARLLLSQTGLSVAEVAAATGFADPRALATAVRAAYGLTPSALRSPDRTPAVGQSIEVRLPFTPPLCPDNLFGHLAATAVPGVEEWRDGAYRRTVRLPHGSGVLALRPGPEHVTARLRLTDRRDLGPALARCRRLVDLDADPAAVDGRLAADPLLAPLVAAAPGRRVPGTVDGAEFAVRAVLGQQVSTAAARTHTARLVLAHGQPCADPDGGLTHLFPEPAALAELDPETLAMPRSRRNTLLTLVRALAAGDLELDQGSDRARCRRQLHALPGIGPWTVESVLMRSLGDPDAFIGTDLGIRAAGKALGLATDRAVAARADRWRPYRAYAVQYLWATLPHAINTLPA